MRETDENITRQLSKLKVFFLKYYPLRIKNVGLEERAARQLVWDFKDGNYYEEVAQMTANRLMEVFGDRVRDIVFSCVPASTTERHELRYKGFSRRVCQLSGAMNGYEHVRVTNDRLEVHRNRRKKDVEIAENVSYDADFFKGKQILVFDDIITRGYSYARFANRLEMCGAEVLGVFFLGKTFYRVNRYIKMTDYPKSMTFAGHRHIPIQRRNELYAKLEKAVKANYANGVRNFNCGMALGFNLLAAEVVVRVKAQHPDITLTAVVPFRRQCERWSDKDRRHYYALISQADKVIVLSEIYYNGCLLKRNDYMLSHCIGVIG